MRQQQQKTDFPKLALYIAGGYLLYKVVSKLGQTVTDPTGVDAANTQFQSGITIDESKLTYPKFQYASWANSLEQTLLIDSTENESLVDSIIYKIQNDNDWKQLVKDFGVRNDYVFGYVPTGSYTLPGALIEFVPERINDYNNHFAGWNMQSRI